MASELNAALAEAENYLPQDQLNEARAKASNLLIDLAGRELKSQQDIEIARRKLGLILDAVRHVPNDPTINFRGEAEHEGVRLTVSRGCMSGVIVVLLGLGTLIIGFM